MLWLIFWTLIMLGLVVAFAVTAIREKARAKAMQKFSPQPLDDASLEEPGDAFPPDDSFPADPLAEPLPDEAGFDENANK